jgi:hypothetical protein
MQHQLKFVTVTGRECMEPLLHRFQLGNTDLWATPGLAATVNKILNITVVSPKASPLS